MKKNLYVVSSPFQCVSAIEARTQLGLDNNILVVIYYSKDGKENYLQMREIFGLLKWENVVEIGLGVKNSKFFEYINIIKKLKKYKYDNVFIGHFSQFQTILLSNLSINNIYSIDDGVITLRLHKEELNPYLNSKIKFLKKIKMLRYSLLLLKTKFDKSRINYFTMFDIKPYYGEKIIKNEFMFMREHSLDKKQSSLVYFLGQPLYEVGILKKDDYFEYIKCIKEYYKHQRITVVYIPHRREQETQSLKVLEDDYFKLKKLSTAVEVYLFKHDWLPKEVCSFVSTGLISLQNIFNMQTKAFYIRKEFLQKNHDSIEKLYDELKDSGVEIVDIKK